MMVKPMKTVELHYPMIQFLINLDISQFYIINILIQKFAREAQNFIHI